VKHVVQLIARMVALTKVIPLEEKAKRKEGKSQPLFKMHASWDRDGAERKAKRMH
jgi:hypothetical protein